MDDDREQDSRPAKRQKTEERASAEPENLPPLTLANLLLSLPSLLLHPPTHTNHERSLALSYAALNQCNTLTSLDRVVECRAATGLVELGLQIGLSAPGVQGEIQKALTKAVSITWSSYSFSMLIPFVVSRSPKRMPSLQAPLLPDTNGVGLASFAAPL